MHGAISFDGGLHISDCIHCGKCLEIEKGCEVFHTLELPSEDGSKKMSLNTFSNHAPKNEWMHDFFRNLDSFLTENSLGRLQISFFRRFLSDAGLIVGKPKNKVASDLARQISKQDVDSALVWAILLTNLVANNPQMRWYLDTVPINGVISKANMISSLEAMEMKKDSISSIVNSFERLVNLPLGTKLGWGFYNEEGRGNATLGRRPCRLAQDDRLAVLYALYVFAEKCGDMRQFTLSRLMDETVQSEGVSPAKLFGLDRETLATFLRGLGEVYPEFIAVTFTHDLEKISLREGKTSADVLALLG